MVRRFEIYKYFVNNLNLTNQKAEEEDLDNPILVLYHQLSVSYHGNALMWNYVHAKNGMKLHGMKHCDSFNIDFPHTRECDDFSVLVYIFVTIFFWVQVPVKCHVHCHVTRLCN